MGVPFTPSSYHRVRSCPASAVLPQSSDVPGDAAIRGTNIHRFIERASKVGKETALAEMAPDALGRDVCERIDLDAVPVDYLCADSELALTMDVHVGESRPLPKGDGDRDYGDLGPYELAGTIDALEYDEGRVIVSDYKTGQPSAAYGPQLELYALMASGLVDAPSATCQVIYIRPDGSVHVERWEMDRDDLDGMHVELNATIEKVEALRGRTLTRADVNPGDHCRWCRSRDACPEYVDAANELATMQPSALAGFRDLIATDAGKAEAWKRLPVLEEIVASMRAELDAAVIAGPVTLDDGSVLGAVKTERRRVSDAGEVRRVLAERCGDEAANEAVEVSYSTTLGAIEKAAGKAKREVIAALEASGAIGVGVSVKAGIVKAKKGRSAA